MRKKIAFNLFVLLLIGAGFCISPLAYAATDDIKVKVNEINQAYLDDTLGGLIEKYIGETKADPNNAELHYLLGVSYLYSEFDTENATFEKARGELIKAKTLDPKLKYVNYSLGYIYWARGEYDKAIEFYRAEITLDPDNAWNYFNLGSAYEGLKEWDKAMSQYIITIDKNPTIADAHNNLGMIAMNWKGNHFRAMDSFKKAVELKPEERLYKENYNKAVKKLKALKASLDRGDVTLPPDQVEKLKKLNLEEMKVE